MLKIKTLSLFFILFIGSGFSQEIDVITQERIQGIITILTYSPYGSLIASGSAKENSIKIWDVKSGKIIGQLEGHEGATTALCFNQDGNKLLSAAKDKYVIQWDLLKWELIDSVQTEAVTTTLLNDPHKTDVFYSGSYRGHVHQWSRTQMDTPVLLMEDRDEITHIDVHRDYMVVGNDKGELSLFNLPKKEVIKSKKAHLNAVKGLKFFNNGESLISLGGGGLVHLWDVNDLSESKHIKASSVPITAFDVNIDLGIFVTATQKLDIRIWNFEGKELKHFKGKDRDNPGREPIKAIALSPDGSTVASSGFQRGISRKKGGQNNVIRIWDVERGGLYKVLEGTVNPIYTFAFHPTENKLVTLGEDRKLTFWDFELAEKYGEIQLVEPKREVAPKRADEMAEGAVNEGKKTFGGFGSLKDKINPDAIKNKIEQKVKEKGTNLAVTAAKRSFKERPIILFSAQGKYLITKLPKDEIRLYKMNGQRPEHEKAVFSYQSNINQILTSPDEKYLVVLGSGDEAVSIIDLETGNFIQQLDTKAPQSDANNGKALKLKYLYEANSGAFSPDGKYFAVCFNTSKTFVFDTEKWNIVFENSLPDNLGYAKGAFVNFSEDGSKMVVNTMSGVQKFTTGAFSQLGSEKLNINGHSASMDKASDYAITIFENYLYFEHLFTGETHKSLRVKPKQITHISINPEGKVGITLKSGQFMLLDPATGKEEILLVADGDNYIFKTGENFYKVSKEGYDLVTFRIGNKAFPFEQFDAVFNRPDLVLKKLGCKDEELINLYEMAYQKRIKKLGLEPTTKVSLSDIPTTKVKNTISIPAATQETAVNLNFDLSDKSNLRSYNIWVNNVPFYGKKGKSISGKTYSGSEKIGLVHGTNKIQISCRNSRGYESLIQTFYVDKSGDTPERNLYLVTIGTSEYHDSRYNLNYAVKDAKDLVSLFGSDTSVYTNVYTESLYNKDVTAQNVDGVHEFLKNSKPDDVVLIFVAGHGVLDNNFDYYFGTYDMDFANPSQKGLAYERLEGLLDGIKANKTILIMDTCHSGEIDKDEVFFAEATEEEENQDEDISFRSVGAAVKEDASLATPSRLAGELFNDLRRGTGATVISSAGGAEFAMESDEWKNGLFTYCLLDGMTSGTADLDKDGQIMLLELQEYVVDKVKALSKGKQIPNSRIQNMELDFRIW